VYEAVFLVADSSRTAEFELPVDLEFSPESDPPITQVETINPAVRRTRRLETRRRIVLSRPCVLLANLLGARPIAVHGVSHVLSDERTGQQGVEEDAVHQMPPFCKSDEAPDC
jgi:hypothetical protein